MDINIDQATPRNDMHMDYNGRFIYKTRHDMHEVDRFNRDFDQYGARRQFEMDRLLQDKLTDLNNPHTEIPFYNRTLGEILIDTKDAIFNLLDDLLAWHFDYDTFTKQNRPFYIGVMLLFIAILVFLFSFVDSII